MIMIMIITIIVLIMVVIVLVAIMYAIGMVSRQQLILDSWSLFGDHPLNLERYRED